MTLLWDDSREIGLQDFAAGEITEQGWDEGVLCGERWIGGFGGVADAVENLRDHLGSFSRAFFW